MLLHDLLVNLLHGCDLRVSLKKISEELNFDVEHVSKMTTENPLIGSYIDTSFPALLVYAFKYSHNPQNALLASSNAGGDNLGRTTL